MQTEVLRVDPRSPDPAAVRKAARALRDGLLVVIPTETVYGLAARADDPLAVEALRRAKGREGVKPLTVHLPDADLGRNPRFPLAPLPPAAARLAARRLPGPLTLVLRNLEGGWTGFRVPDDPVARAVLREAGCPVVATSVNRAGEEPALTGVDAAIFAAGTAAVVLDAGPARLGRPSTVVRIGAEGPPEVLREGVVPASEVLRDAARLLLFVCTGNICRSPLAAALAAEVLAGREGVSPADLPSRGIAVGSAGTAAASGLPPPPEALAEARSRGLDLSGHRSRPLTPGLLDAAERVFVMEAVQRTSILGILPDAAEKVLLLDPSGRDVPDPYGRGSRAYARSAKRIREAVEKRFGGEKGSDGGAA